MAPLDELLLAEAKEAQAAQVHAQAQAELARVRFAAAVRRLHEGGASMREIAGAFKLSHQRVHQLVTGENKAGKTLRCSCSFCGIDQRRARKLIAGPGVYVCERCVDMAVSALQGDPAAEQRWAAQRRSDVSVKGKARKGRTAAATCSFCGKSSDQVAGMADGGPFRICRECLDLCQEIIGEELGEG